MFPHALEKLEILRMTQFRKESIELEEQRALTVHHLSTDPEEHLADLHQAEKASLEAIVRVGDDADAPRRITRLILADNILDQRCFQARVGIQKNEYLPSGRARAAIFRSCYARLVFSDNAHA